MLITELAADLKAQGKTLYDGLIDLYEKYGYYLENVQTKTLAGIEGLAQIKAIMKKFRDEGVPFDLEKALDYSTGIDGLPKSDVLKYFLKDGSLFTVRPSGTEPKIKFYFGVSGTSKEDAEKKVELLKETVMKLVD